MVLMMLHIILAQPNLAKVVTNQSIVQTQN